MLTWWPELALKYKYSSGLGFVLLFECTNAEAAAFDFVFVEGETARAGSCTDEP